MWLGGRNIEDFKNDQVIIDSKMRKPRNRLLVPVTICVAICIVMAGVVIVHWNLKGITAFEGKAYADDQISLLCSTVYLLL